MNSSLRSFVAVLLGAALIALVSSGCQTSKGLGRDVEKLGEKIQEKSR